MTLLKRDRTVSRYSVDLTESLYIINSAVYYSYNIMKSEQKVNLFKNITNTSIPRKSNLTVKQKTNNTLKTLC